MRIDRNVAVIVCAGPSLERLSALGWAEIGKAGAVVGVNGAPAAEACERHAVEFTMLSAMDIGSGLFESVPRLASLWRSTRAWRVTSVDCASAEADFYIHEVHEADGVCGWSDHPAQGYKGGSSGMVIGNWVGNPWPGDSPSNRPPRGFRKLAYIGLDMHPNDGAHASGSGFHVSGFARSAAQFEQVRAGWGRFCAEAARRGVEIVNLTPLTGLDTMPRASVPDEWVLAS